MPHPPVADRALAMLNDQPTLNCIVDGCFELQLNASTAPPSLESRFKQVQAEIDNVMRAIKVGIITATTKSTLEGLEGEKEAPEISID